MLTVINPVISRSSPLGNPFHVKSMCTWSTIGTRLASLEAATRTSKLLLQGSHSHGKSGKVMEKFLVMESHGKVMENNKNIESHGKMKFLP